MAGVLRTAIAFLDKEGKRIFRSRIPLKKRLWGYRHGFLSRSVELYDLDEELVGRYISDLQLRRTGAINEPNRNLLDNKQLFHCILRNKYSSNLPDLLGRIDDGCLVDPLSGDRAADALPDLLDEHAGGFVCKPDAGTKGRGVFAVRETTTGFSINDRQIEKEDLLSLLRALDGYIIEEFVEQAEYARGIYPGSVNTVRVVTMVDPDTAEPFIGTAVHRFGTDDSAPVDNWSSGGICAAIDRETGELSAAAAQPISGTPVFHDNHPDSGAPIDGTSVPSWEAVRDAVLSIADDVKPFLTYIGWDVVLTSQDGTFVCLEANSRTDVDLLQIHGPLLADSRVKRFYEYHDIC